MGKLEGKVAVVQSQRFGMPLASARRWPVWYRQISVGSAYRTVGVLASRSNSA